LIDASTQDRLPAGAEWDRALCGFVMPYDQVHLLTHAAAAAGVELPAVGGQQSRSSHDDRPVRAGLRLAVDHAGRAGFLVVGGMRTIAGRVDPW
jgi:hypothetical protein